MKSTFNKTPVAIAVLAFCVSGAALADAVTGQTSVNDDLNTTSDLSINNRNTTMNNEVNYTETDDLNLTTNRVQNNEQNSEVNETIDHTTNVTENRTSSNTTDSEFNTSSSSTSDVSESRDVSMSKSVNLEGDMSMDADVSHSMSADIDEHHSLSTENDLKQVDENVSKDWDESKHVVVNVKEVELSKSLSLTKDITIEGGITVSGELTPDSSAVAVIDDKQFNTGNGNLQIPSDGDVEQASVQPMPDGQNYMLSNEASSGDDMMSGASGNIAVNINAGDNNMQDNASALAAADTSFVFGMVDAEVFVRQEAHQNSTSNHGVDNLAMIGENAFMGASGNIGVNFAAGNSNLQKNNFSAAVANGVISEASVNTQQHSSGNWTSNSGEFSEANGEPGGVSGHMAYADVTLEADLEGYDTGNMSGHYGDLPNPTEETGLYTLEDGSVDPANGYRSNHEGDIGANEVSDYSLSGSFSGQHPYWVIDECGGGCANGAASFATNTVSLDNQAFMGASGNIGANMASGSGNLQSNSLAMSVTGR